MPPRKIAKLDEPTSDVKLSRRTRSKKITSILRSKNSDKNDNVNTNVFENIDEDSSKKSSESRSDDEEYVEDNEDEEEKEEEEEEEEEEGSAIEASTKRKPKKATTVKVSKVKKISTKKGQTKEKKVKPIKKKDSLIYSIDEIKDFYAKNNKSSIVLTEPAEKQMKSLGRNVYKVEKMFGLFNNEKLSKIGEFMKTYEDSTVGFNVDEPVDVFGEQESEDELLKLYKPIRDTLRLQKFKKISKQDFQQVFKAVDQTSKKLLFDSNDKVFTLPPGKQIPFPDSSYGKRHGSIRNTDGLVTDMAWTQSVNTPTYSPEKQYLVIAKSQFNNSAIEKHISLKTHDPLHYACIDVIEVELKDNDISCKIISSYLHKFGEIKNLRILPMKSDNSIPLLFCTQQGTVELVNIPFPETPTIQPEYFHLENSVSTYKMNAQQITAFDIINKTSIVVGFESGHVAEFDLLDRLTPELPSYYVKTHESNIYSIAAGHMQNETTVVVTASGDGSVKAFDPKDPITSLMPLRKARTLSTCEVGYSPSCHAFTYSDGFGTLKISCASTLYSSSYLSAHEYNVTTSSSSKYHPLTLSGGDDGNIYIFNSLKKLVIPQRVMNPLYKSCRLWNWAYQRDIDCYRLDGNYKLCTVSGSVDTKQDTMKAPGTTISCCRWNETVSGFKIYAFVNNAGFLIIEKLS